MLNKFLIKDTSGKKSITMTAFVVGFLVVNLKLVCSGMTIGILELSAFTGAEYSLCIAALGGTYILRRSTQNGKEKK